MSKTSRRILPIIAILCVVTLLSAILGVLFVLPRMLDRSDPTQKRLTAAENYISLIEEIQKEHGDASDGPIGLLYADVLDLDNDGVEELITIHNTPSSESAQLQLYTSAHLEHTMPLAIGNPSFRVGFTIADEKQMLVTVSEHADDQGNSVQTTVLYSWDGSSVKEAYTYIEDTHKERFSINGKESSSSQFLQSYEKHMMSFYELLISNEHLDLLRAGITHTKERLQSTLDTKASSPVSTVEAITAEIGKSVFFGKFEQDNNLENGPEPIEWIVLGSAAEGGVIVTSRYGLYTPNIQPDYETTYTWENSPFREWLADEFLPTAFTPSEQHCILPTEVSDGKWIGDYTKGFTFNEESYVIDRAYLMSLDEASLYFESDEERKLSPTPYANALGAYRNENGDGLWWLRTPNVDGHLYKMVCEGYGFSDQLNDYMLEGGFAVDYNANVMLRPVMRLSSVTTQEGVVASDLSYHPRSFETVTFGHYEQDSNTANGQEPVEWVVLDEKDGHCLLLSKYTLDCRKYHETYEQNLSWQNADIYRWLNGTFLSGAFSDAEQKALIGSDNGTVFLLNKSETAQYLPLDIDRIATPTAYALSRTDSTNAFSGEIHGSYHWSLRRTNSDSNDGVHCTGLITSYYFDFIGVRPAIWVDKATVAKSTSESDISATTTTSAPKANDAWKDAYLHALRNISESEAIVYEDSDLVLRYIDNDDIPELFVITPFVASGTIVYTYENGTVNTITISQGNYSYIPKENCFHCNGGRQDYYHDTIYAIEQGLLVEKQRGETHVAQWTENGPVMDYIRWDGEDMSQDQYNDRLNAAIDQSRAVSLRDDGNVHSYYTIQDELSK